MKIKSRKEKRVLKASVAVSVLIIAVAATFKVDASLRVYAASAQTVSVATAMPQIPSAATVPVSGTVTSPFGERINPISKREEFHKGVDIAAEEGTPIQLVFDGTVAEVGENEIYGKYVLVDHSNELYTRYCHCSRVLVETGYKLKRGELVALVGSTGWSTGSHLHLEIISNGKYIDPEWILEW